MNRNRRRPRGATAFPRVPPGVALAAVLVLLLAVPAGAQTLIDPDPLGLIQNETSLALIPGPVPGVPQLLAVAYNNDPLTNTGLGVALSQDGGVTWALMALPMPTDPAGSIMTDAFDPAAGFDALGNLFVAQISTLGGYPGAGGLFVHRYDSITGLWYPPTIVAYSPPATMYPDPFYRFNDKCHLTVDRDPVGISPYLNNVYATWIQDGGYGVGPWSDIFFAWSANQGATWNYPAGSPVPVPINDIPYVPGGPPPFGMDNGPNVAVAPDGTVYVAWMEVDVTVPQTVGTLWIDRSFNGGLTWGTDIMVQPPLLNCPGNLSTVSRADARARSFPALAVSPLPNLQGFYDVYMVFAADPDNPGGPDEGDIYFTRSADGGLTWIPPIRVNQDLSLNDQFEPWIAVKPNGWIDVAWYDRRNDPLDTWWDVVVTRSIDRGNTWAPELFITDPTIIFQTPHMAWGEYWMGEYLGLAVDSEFLYLAFTSSVTDTLGDVYFAARHNYDINTSVPGAPELGDGVGLRLDCPNPFRPDAVIVYGLPAAGKARVAVHDLAGRLVRVLVNEPCAAGEHRVVWDGRDERGRPAAAGVYFLRLEAGENRVTEKITLLR